ncbi:Aminopeptidase [Frankia sp. AiPs1]|uniref:hypothetical protein n=1 Tax=Frankia sp. AiPa1 TaxID=573492 RepID=UPI00202B7229|nr:hypothetical protein [Frankia sp. AiPa1]MCL9760664.1 hypothetical protein [Frankia sp. AiPa1]
MTGHSRRMILGTGGATLAASMAAMAGCSNTTGGAGSARAGRAAASASASGLGAADADAIGSDGLVTADTLWSWVERMCSFGPRHTGSPAHRRHIDDLDARLRALGLEVTRHPVPLVGWLARRWALRVTDHQGTTSIIPVAAYRPLSGETPDSGVTGRVVDVGAGGAADYQGKAVAGAVVLAEGTIARLTAKVLTDMADDLEPSSDRAAIDTEDYTRVWLGIPAQPDLALARGHGAIAMIEILDLPAALAAGQYTPHQQVPAGLPTLHVDPEQGARLRALLTAGPLTATVVLAADHGDTTIDYLLARLPATHPPASASSASASSASASEAGTAGTGSKAVLVATHTDGQNAVEENGGPALLAIAERLVRQPAAQRHRDVLFLFSPAHMRADTSTVKPDAWLRSQPDLLASIGSTLVAEHLGAMAWDDDGGKAPYGPRGRSELAIVAVGNSPRLRQLAIDEVRASGITRLAVMPPFENGLYGEGTFAYRLGLPTVAFISGPTYLLQAGAGDQRDKLDRQLLHRHTALIARLLDRMLATPA